MRASDLVLARIPAGQARAIVGTTDLGVTATGSSQATAYAVRAALTDVTTAAASTGVILPAANAGDSFVVGNRGDNALAVYPPVGGGINAIATNTAVSLDAGETASFHCVGTIDFVAVIGSAT